MTCSPRKRTRTNSVYFSTLWITFRVDFAKLGDPVEATLALFGIGFDKTIGKLGNGSDFWKGNYSHGKLQRSEGSTTFLGKYCVSLRRLELWFQHGNEEYLWEILLVKMLTDSISNDLLMK